MGRVLLVLCATSLVAISHAEAEPVLHENFEPEQAIAPALVGEAQDGRNPSAIRVADHLLVKPEAKSDATQGIVFGRQGPVTSRVGVHRPNDQTVVDGSVQYTEVFNPSVMPFKRMSAFDRVRQDFALESAIRATKDVPIEAAPAQWDLFWGDFAVELTPGEQVAIPSVAPGMKVVSYETFPRTSLTFARDGADNYFVRSDDPGASGSLRVVLLVAANPHAFAATVPGNLRLGQLKASLIQPMPSNVKLAALRAIRHLGLSARLPVSELLQRLVDYHRKFSSAPLKVRSPNLFEDLFYSQRGVCRHRAYTFMIVANALGIPTRVVQNEAHAWVEVHLPQTGWSRIDLGGAALQVDLRDTTGKVRHRPRFDDPFGKPPSASETQAWFQNDVESSSDGRDEASLPREPEDGAARSSGRRSTKIDFELTPASAYRGELVELRGRVTTKGRGVPGLQVELSLAPRRGSGLERSLGVAVTDQAGHFRAQVRLPSNLAMADHEFWARTKGDELHDAAQSN